MKVRLSCLILMLANAAFTAIPDSADSLIAAATAKASAENKAIYLCFGASWCIWCQKLEAFWDRSDVKPVFELPRYHWPA
jgi:hypothetical protein